VPLGEEGLQLWEKDGYPTLFVTYKSQNSFLGSREKKIN
jgi:hypothetical protein